VVIETPKNALDIARFNAAALVDAATIFAIDAVSNKETISNLADAFTAGSRENVVNSCAMVAVSYKNVPVFFIESGIFAVNVAAYEFLSA
jgi:hypothetical protein